MWRGKRGRLRTWMSPGVMSVAEGDWRPQILPSIYSHICDPITTCMVPFPAAAKSHQSCPTLCDPIDGGPPGSPVPGILQARTLEWVAISFSNAWTWKVKVKSLSRVRPSVTPWTAAYQAPPSIGFSRQEYWSGVPLPSPWFLFLVNCIWHITLCKVKSHNMFTSCFYKF